jgi:hypothetical protein
MPLLGRPLLGLSASTSGGRFLMGHESRTALNCYIYFNQVREQYLKLIETQWSQLI